MSNDEIPEPTTVTAKDTKTKGFVPSKETQSTRALYGQVKGSSRTVPQSRRQERINEMNEAKNQRVGSTVYHSANRSVKARKSSSFKHHPVENATIMRKRLRSKIARASKAVESSKFSESKGLKRFHTKWNNMKDPSMTSFRNVDKIRMPKMKGMKKNRFKGFNRKMKKMRLRF
ncbi:MAG: hypothetical protein R6U21_06870 [Thermoplasmatota archaeon]